MPATYTDPTADYSDAVFTALEKEHIRNIIGLSTLGELDTPISELTADQRRVTRNLNTSSIWGRAIPTAIREYRRAAMPGLSPYFQPLGAG